jgi:hypothetical protein
MGICDVKMIIIQQQVLVQNQKTIFAAHSFLWQKKH